MNTQFSAVRKIHFGITASSLVLLAFFVTRDQDDHEALREIEAVQTIYQDARNKYRTIHGFVNEAVARIDEDWAGLPDSPRVIASIKYLSLPIGKRRISGRLETKSLWVPRYVSGYYEPQAVNSVPSALSHFFDQGGLPYHLSAFENLWNLLAKKPPIYFAPRLGRHGAIVFTPGMQNGRVVEEIVINTAPNRDHTFSAEVRFRCETESVRPAEFFRGVPEQIGWDYSHYLGCGINFTPEGATASVSTGYRLLVPLEYSQSDVRMQDVLLDPVRYEIPQGYFHNSFPSLSRKAKNLKNVSLDEVRAELNERAKGTSSNFSFGEFKIPLGPAGLFMIIVIVSLQCLLYVHLIHIRTLLPLEAFVEICEVDWSGMFDSFLARFVTMLTCNVLPVAMILLSIIYLWFDLGFRAISVVSAVVLPASLILGYRSMSVISGLRNSIHATGAKVLLSPGE